MCKNGWFLLRGSDIRYKEDPHTIVNKVHNVPICATGDCVNWYNLMHTYKMVCQPTAYTTEILYV